MCTTSNSTPSEPTDAPLVQVELQRDLPEEAISLRLAQGLRLGDVGQRTLAFYLVEIDDRGLFQEGGYRGVRHYAKLTLGLGRRRVAELLRVGRKLLELPAIDAAFCAGELTWSKVLLLARVASPEHEAAWLALAIKLPCRRLAKKVATSKPGKRPSEGGKGLPETRFLHTARCSALTHGMIKEAKEKLAAERGEVIGDAELLRIAAQLVLSTREDGSVPGREVVDDSVFRVVLYAGDTPEDADELCVDDELGRIPLTSGEAEAVRCDATCVHPDENQRGRDRKTPAGLRARVRTRDGNQCRCCSSRHELMVHHIKFLSDGGRTTARNLITLCARCHSLVHEGLLVLEGQGSGPVRFLDREGRSIDRVAPPRLEGAARVALTAAPMGTSGSAERSADAPRAVTSLDAIPTEIDGAWWQAHAHLMACRGDGGLSYRAGRPAPASAERSAAPAPDAAAFRGLRGAAGRAERLNEFVEGCRQLDRAFPHVLFEGPPGTGKTTFAHALSARLGARRVDVNGPMLTRVRELVRVLATLEEGAVLCIDEIHAVPQPVLEVLYQALAEGALSLTLHSGVRSRAVRLALPRFTLMAATTDRGALEPAMLSRFGLVESFELFPVDALAEIARTAGRSAGFDVTERAARRLAERARGTPREVLRLAQRAMELGALRSDRRIGHADAERVLAQLGFDAQGLVSEERRYLRLLRECREPVSVGRLARMFGGTVRTLTSYIEPYLIRAGLVRVTPRGREAVHRPHLLTTHA